MEPLQSRFHAAASKRIGAGLKSSLMLSTAARRAASIAFHRTASEKATRRQLKYQRTSKGKAMNIAARRRMSDLMFPTGKMVRSEEHTSELQSLMRTSYAVFCLKTKNNN